jgi:hypothetical protein
MADLRSTASNPISGTKARVRVGVRVHFSNSGLFFTLKLKLALNFIVIKFSGTKARVRVGVRVHFSNSGLFFTPTRPPALVSFYNTTYSSILM